MQQSEILKSKDEILENGSKVYYGDTIVVSEKSNAQVLFSQTVITIGEKSELTIDEFVYDPETNDGKFVSNINQNN